MEACVRRVAIRAGADQRGHDNGGADMSIAAMAGDRAISAPESVELLDGGEKGYPRMLLSPATSARIAVTLSSLPHTRPQSGCRDLGPRSWPDAASQDSARSP